MTEEETPVEEAQPSCEEALETLRQEVEEYKDKYLRQLAEGENARKRMMKERVEVARYAVEGVVAEWLAPLDSFEQALKFAENMSGEVKNWAYGFQMILAQFKEVLAQNGITSFESVGKPFNPHEHEAVEMVESDAVPPGYVVEESVKGYKMGDRVIRVARVKVAKNKE